MHSNPTEIVGNFPKWKSCLIRLTINTSLFFPKSVFRSFLKNKVVLLLLTSPINKIEPEKAYNNTTTSDKLVCTVMWSLASVKTNLEFLGRKMTPTTWICN